jgi:uncharacterized membrane protein
MAAGLLRRYFATFSICLALGFHCADAARAAVPVYGSPERDPASGVTYQNQPIQFLSDSRVSDDGRAAWIADGPSGQVMIRWDKSGANPIVTALPYQPPPPSPTSLGLVVLDFLPSGEAVGSGYWSEASYQRHGVRWDSAGTPTFLQPLGTPPTPMIYAPANGISPTGIAVGEAAKYVAGNSDPVGFSAVKWDANGVPTELAMPAQYRYSSATAMNASGVAVGSVDTDQISGRPRAVRWDAAGNMTMLAAFPTATGFSADTRADRITNTGWVLGVAQRAFREWVPALWDPQGNLVDLHWLGYSSGDLQFVLGRDVNNSGQVVGSDAIYDAAGRTPLENSQQAWAINDSGMAAGSVRFNDTTHAAVWRPDGSAIDLNALIDPSSGWELTSARDISNTGWVSGIGRYDPDRGGPEDAYVRGFLLQVPEPSSAAVAALAAGACLLRRRRGAR